MAKPLVTHVLWTLERGGAERLVFDLASRLPEAGFDVEVLAAGGGGAMEDQFRAAGIRLSVNLETGSRFKAVKFLRDSIKRRRPAIWHTHLTPVWGGTAAKTSFVSPWIATAHGFEPGLSLSARLARRTAYRAADHVVCVSEAVRQAIHRQYGVSPAKTSVIAPGIDFARFSGRGTRLAGDVPEIVTLGRLAPEKGLDTLFFALADLLRPWHLTVVGDGPERGSLMRLAEMLGILPRITFVGAVSEPAIYLKTADLFCLPSLHEGQGMALLEAAGAHVPVVASDLPAIREAFDEETAVFAAPNDAGSWRVAIERALNRYPDSLARADAAEKRVLARYSVEAMVSKHAALYRRFLRAPL
jgi:glycosyltransferase involved in cell wall biosynthesis